MLDAIDVIVRVDKLVHTLQRLLPMMEERRNEQAVTRFAEPSMASLLEKLTKGSGRGNEKQVDALLKKLKYCSHIVTDRSGDCSEAGIPEELRSNVFEEYERLKAMSTNSPEHSSLHSYLQLISELPWKATTEDSIDIARARYL